ncbi:uncharacterized protein LOC123228151 [Mangifera indica]|uniref:uncharacterized protein LOC123228151 n=1 Tax=Mangifera indica TaxID=29780 RepID=UPI001CFA350D|nr:uncharacterized protein LOC123228151 [Mangifera indica]XP_044509356.1 uncharacterized protein LOC123228151 [Mangifera indica]
MVQQAVDSKVNEYRLGSPETNLPTCDKQQPVAAKKIALRELQNENRLVVPNATGSSPYSKDRGPVNDAIKVSGTKRPVNDYPVSPSRDQSLSSNVTNGHLVYVRRKSETELGNINMSDSTTISSDCVHPKQAGQSDRIHQHPQIKEPKVSCFPAFAPLPMTSLTSSSGKPSVPQLGRSVVKSPAESNYHPIGSASPLEDPRGMKNLLWPERFHQLQMLLKRLDQSDQEEYVQMLRSLSSAELSRHAVALEKRSIQLSLEEAKEVNRVAMLNVLGKSIKNLREPLTHPDRSSK